MLYEYIKPSNRIVEDVTKYEKTAETSNAIKEISNITAAEFESETVIKSYTVTDRDLNNYKKNDNYSEGRGNPFENVVFNPSPVISDTSSGDTTGGTTQNKNNTSTGYFTQSGKNK